MNAVPMREKQVNIRLSNDEAALLDAVLDHYGVNVANLFRMMLKKERRELGLDVAQAPAKKTAKVKK